MARKYLYGSKEEKPDFQKAMTLLLLEAHRGNGYACYDLARMYLLGQGVEQSDTEAYSLFYMAATHEKQPNAYAQYQLGRMCRDGTGAEVNLEEAKLWFARAYIEFLAMEETMADDRLYYRLGSMNMTGTGTEVDLERAKYYFEKAVELGNADAMYGLGKLYLKPEFPGHDPVKAVEYLEKAVAKDHAFAKYQLGKLLCQGELVEPFAKKPLKIPPKHENMRRVYGYLLRRRGIDKEVLDAFTYRGLVYECACYHNAVFVGMDKAGNEDLIFSRKELGSSLKNRWRWRTRVIAQYIMRESEIWKVRLRGCIR